MLQWLYLTLPKLPVWQSRLVYREPKHTTGILFTLGLTEFGIALGWRVPELREFPVFLGFGLFRRRDFAERVDAVYFTFQIQFGTRTSSNLRRYAELQKERKL